MSKSSAASAAPADFRPGFKLLIALIVLVAVGKPILCDTMDPDCFWHLRVAEQLREQLHSGTLGPLHDNLSFASTQEPWTPYSWLAELGMDGIWRIGGWRAAIATQSLMSGGLVLLIAMSCLAGTQPLLRTRRSAGADASALSRPADRADGDDADTRLLPCAVATAAAMLLSMAYLSFRPVTAALVVLALCCWLITHDRRQGQRSARVWLLIPLTALLINVHLYAIFIPMWVSALWVGALWDRAAAAPERKLEASRRAERYSWMLVGTGLACLATPMLPGVVMTMLHYQTSDPMVASGVIAEMRPFYRGFAGAVSAAIVLLIFGCAVHNRRRLSVGEWLWLLLALAVMFRLGRFAPQFAIVSAPMFAVVCPHLRPQLLARPAIRMAMALVLVGGVARLAVSFPRRDATLDQWLERLGPDVPGYPCGAADFIAASVKPTTGRLINEFTWGGFIEWRFNGRFQTLLDGRTQLFSPDFWHATYLGAESDREAYLAKIHADAALLPARRSVFDATLRRQGWTVAYEDDRARVFIPPPRAKNDPAPWPFATVLMGE